MFLQLLPYLRMAGNNLQLAIDRAERIVEVFPRAWFAGGGSCLPSHLFFWVECSLWFELLFDGKAGSSTVFQSGFYGCRKPCSLVSLLSFFCASLQCTKSLRTPRLIRLGTVFEVWVVLCLHEIGISLESFWTACLKLI